MILCFELTMPNRGSWNGHWSGEEEKHCILNVCRTKAQQEQAKALNGKDFYHVWNDGWTACISCSIVDHKEAAKIRKINRGFCGYDWMVTSILTGRANENDNHIPH